MPFDNAVDLLMATSGMSEEELRKMKQKRAREAALQGRIDRDLQNATEIQRLMGQKTDARQKLMEGNIEALDPMVAQEARKAAVAAAMQRQVDQYGPDFQRRQMGPHSDLGVDDRQQRLLLHRASQAGPPQGWAMDGTAVRMPGESKESYIDRVMAGPRSQNIGPRTGPRTEVDPALEALPDRSPPGVRTPVGEIAARQKETGRRPVMGSKAQMLTEDEIGEHSFMKAKRDAARAQRNTRMATRRKNLIAKAAQEREEEVFNRITRNMTPAERGKYAAEQGRNQILRTQGEQKQEAERRKATDTKIALRRQFYLDEKKLLQERYPVPNEASKQKEQDLRAEMESDVSRMEQEYTSGGSPQATLGPPSDPTEQPDMGSAITAMEAQEIDRLTATGPDGETRIMTKSQIKNDPAYKTLSPAAKAKIDEIAPDRRPGGLGGFLFPGRVKEWQQNQLERLKALADRSPADKARYEAARREFMPYEERDLESLRLKAKNSEKDRKKYQEELKKREEEQKRRVSQSRALMKGFGLEVPF